MTVADLQEHVWRRLGVRRLVVGRQTVDDLVELSVEEWPCEILSHARDDEQRQIVLISTLASVKRAYQVVSGKDVEEYGFFWAFLLQAVAAAVVQIILKWWLERNANRTLIRCWQADRTVR